jgi:predicted metal-dependent enzyme (double-stranded beta helix superfamily)
MLVGIMGFPLTEAPSIHVPRPHGRYLSGAELEAVAASVSAQPEHWRGLVRADSEQRVYEKLVDDDHLAVWLICWMDGHDTGFHDHDRSSGAVTVVQGKLREEQLRFGAPPATRVVGAGEAFGFEATDIHRVVHAEGEPAVSVHAYSPPLDRMGSYVVEEGGALRRQSLGGGDELRPLAAAG